MKEYTPIVEGFQIRDITYLSDDKNYEKNFYPTEFDIVKWNKDNSVKSCYSVGYLKWNPREPCFEFQSIGLRWIEAKPSEKVCDMILLFCKMMEIVLDNEI